MADYYPLIARAVAGLENSTGEARRAMYERARTALIAQLRGVDPPLSESEITRERLALEEAVRKVEAEAAQRARTERPKLEPKPDSKPDSKPEAEPRIEPRAESPSEPKPDAPRAARPGDALRAPIPRPASSRDASRDSSRAPAVDRAATARDTRPSEGPSARSRAGLPPTRPRSPGAPSDQALRGLREEADALGRATSQANRSARRSFAAVPTPSSGRAEPSMGQELHDQGDHEPTYYNESNGEAVRPQPPRQRTGRPQQAPQRRVRSSGGLLKTLALIGILLVIVGGLIWVGPTLLTMARGLFATTQQTAQAPKGVTPSDQRPKIPDRVGQPESNVAPVAQRVVLYDEDPAEPQGRQYNGTVVWRVETVQGGANQPPDLAVRADVEIPDRKFKMALSIRRNNDATLPASHTAELTFTLPPDFDGGSVANVPGILMKQTEQTRGTPLAGLAVKVTDGFFLIGLSNVETDRQRNIQLLKERAWFDVPIVYGNQRRAILAIEKGSPGERAFAEAFAAWGQ